MLDRWIAEAMAEDHKRGITHGAGISSTGGFWCFECWVAQSYAVPSTQAVTPADPYPEEDE